MENSNEYFNLDFNQMLYKLVPDLLSRLMSCVVIVLICGFAVIVLGILKKRTQQNISPDPKEKRKSSMKLLFYSILKYAIYILGLCQMLRVFNIEPQTLLTLAGVGGIAIGFGAQSLIQDCITGIFLLMEGQFGAGDLITIESHTGTVESIGIRTTSIRSFDGNMHIIPNSEIKSVTNMTMGYKRALVNLKLGYEYPLEKMLEAIQDELNKMPVDKDILYEVPTVVGIIDMDDRHVTVRIAAECKVGENWGIEREIRKRIAIRIQQEKGAKPYPYYNVVLHNKNAQDQNA